jgi:hypothetical protein
MDIVVEHAGRKYTWNHGTWIDPGRHLRAPEGLRNQLNAQMFAYLRTLRLGEHITDPLARRDWVSVLRDQCDAPEGLLAQIGFLDEAMDRNPVAALTAYYDNACVPQGRSFTNCPWLRDRFFEAIAVRPFPLVIRIIGHGPFAHSDFKKFLLTHEIELCDNNDRAHAVVLGRDGWQHAEVDALIEDYRGHVLQVYSQEMLVSVLAGQPDPFSIWPYTDRLRDLYAFRAHHPGLEYVSSGWAGWVTGFGGAAAPTSSVDNSLRGQLECSPLAILGYRVGASGVSAMSRRNMLQQAFSEPLPNVGGPDYMEQWGRPRSGQRLRRIAEQLLNNVMTHRNRPSHVDAVEDWQEDLRWLKETFYKGVYAFHWPQI